MLFDNTPIIQDKQREQYVLVVQTGVNSPRSMHQLHTYNYELRTFPLFPYVPSRERDRDPISPRLELSIYRYRFLIAFPSARIKRSKRPAVKLLLRRRNEAIVRNAIPFFLVQKINKSVQSFY